MLIVGGNDTTRNSISSGVHALHQFPEQNTKLRADPSIIPNMVDEIIRWQTPLAHMRRTATRDVEFRGQQIKAGDKVVLWYLSANRDERVIKDPDTFQVDRPYARKHLAFGHGIHRCMGSRLAQLQLTIAWEEILKRIASIEVIGEPERTYSNFVNGYTQLMVRITR